MESDAKTYMVVDTGEGISVVPVSDVFHSYGAPPAQHACRPGFSITGKETLEQFQSVVKNCDYFGDMPINEIRWALNEFYLLGPLTNYRPVRGDSQELPASPLEEEVVKNEEHVPILNFSQTPA